MEDDAEIIINGTKCTPEQAWTVRVALENFAMDLKHELLGEDEHGKKITKLYQKRLSEIRKNLYKRRWNLLEYI